MDPLFYAVHCVFPNCDGDPHAIVAGDEGDINDACLGDHWGGNEAIYDVPHDYGERN